MYVIPRYAVAKGILGECSAMTFDWRIAIATYGVGQ